ncbi:MAG: hypothetical protein ACKOC0_05665, partial [Cytophagales bacterium]
MRRYYLALLSVLAFQCCTPPTPSVQFTIAFTKEMSDQAQDGRLLLMLAKSDKTEPRFQINEGLNTQLIFGVDVEAMKPGDKIAIDAKAFGFPIRNVSDVPAGEYVVQALINRYETFHLKSGQTVKLPP